MTHAGASSTPSGFEPGGNRSGWLSTAAAAARSAGRTLARSSAEVRNRALAEAARSIRSRSGDILAANRTDVSLFDGPPSLRDRLTLNSARIEAMARGLESIAALPDPLTRELGSWTRPNGLRISRVPMPIGVIGIIYESRPNVGVEASALAMKAGNGLILRGGSDSVASALVLDAAMRAGLESAGLPQHALQMAPDGARDHVAEMLRAYGLIDLLVPRGGKALVERVRAEARMPVMSHAEGLCHTYVHAGADASMARKVLANAKMRRPAICSATETLLIDGAIAGAVLPLVAADMAELGCRMIGDFRAATIVPSIGAATEADFATEWHDAILCVAVVDGVEDALAHIEHYGGSHTDAIITEDAAAAAEFLARIDSAVGLWNASTQFDDGAEFGFGGEVGIATGRAFARGPIGLEQLTTFRYVVTGSGQIRS